MTYTAAHANSIVEAIKGYLDQEARINHLQDAHDYKTIENYDELYNAESITLDNIVITSATTFKMQPIDFIDLINIYTEDKKAGIYDALKIAA